MKINDIINKIKQKIIDLDYFEDVYTFPKWNAENSPFCVILDSPATSQTRTNVHIEVNTNIDIYICVRFDVIDGQTDDSKMEEANRQLREIYDKLKIDLLKRNLIEDLNTDYIYNPIYSDDIIMEVNIVRRKISLQFKELINRI